MRIVFIGTGAIGVPALRSLLASPEHEVVGIVTQPDKPAGRQQRIAPTPIKLAAARSGLPILQPTRVKQPEAVAQIAALAPEVIVVMAYGQILPRALLAIPKIACLNLHASLLPRHRGAAPIQAAIVAGDRETGITVMYMDEGLDTGDILLQTKMEIAASETGGSLHDRLGALAPAALTEALEQLRNGRAPRTPQDSSAATYAAKLEREHGQIEWRKSEAEIERRIRAFDPWPGAFALLDDNLGQRRKLKVFRARVISEKTGADPGRIFSTETESLAVGAGVGGVSLLEVQLEGKRRMSIEEFVRGNQWVRNATIIQAS